MESKNIDFYINKSNIKVENTNLLDNVLKLSKFNIHKYVGYYVYDFNDTTFYKSKYCIKLCERKVLIDNKQMYIYGLNIICKTYKHSFLLMDFLKTRLLSILGETTNIKLRRCIKNAIVSICGTATAMVIPSLYIINRKYCSSNDNLLKIREIQFSTELSKIIFYITKLINLPDKSTVDKTNCGILIYMINMCITKIGQIYRYINTNRRDIYEIYIKNNICNIYYSTILEQTIIN